MAHVFGGISLPSCSNFALKKYGEEVSSIYVDDMLKSFPSAKIAVDMVHKVKSFSKESGFNLRKFPSNHIDVLESIPDDIEKME